VSKGIDRHGFHVPRQDRSKDRRRIEWAGNVYLD
jgi:hypothetical protein